MPHEKGFSIIESILSLGLLGILSIAFLGSVNTGTVANSISEEKMIAESLIRSEMEFIKSTSYQYSTEEYPVDPSLELPPGWDMPDPAVEALHEPDAGIQKITIVVQHKGIDELTATIYKMDR